MHPVKTLSAEAADVYILCAVQAVERYEKDQRLNTIAFRLLFKVLCSLPDDCGTNSCTMLRN